MVFYHKNKKRKRKKRFLSLSSYIPSFYWFLASHKSFFQANAVSVGEGAKRNNTVAKLLFKLIPKRFLRFLVVPVSVYFSSGLRDLAYFFK